MNANRPIKHLKKGDTVQIIAGAQKGLTGKVLKVSLKEQGVQIEGIGIRTRRQKASQFRSSGTKEVHSLVSISKVKPIPTTDETKATKKTKPSAKETK